jgi:hypothetical protein
VSRETNKIPGKNSEQDSEDTTQHNNANHVHEMTESGQKRWAQVKEDYASGKARAKESYASGKERAKESYASGKEKAKESYASGKEKAKESYASGKVEAKEKSKSGFALLKAYGPVAIGFYASMYVGTLSGIFYGLDHDIFYASTFGFEPQAAVSKVVDYMDLLPFEVGDFKVYVQANPRVGTFALAWVMAKFTEPVRLGVTVLVVPRFAKWLGRAPTKRK